jgi:DNA-binding IclR family transcriptional regulator
MRSVQRILAVFECFAPGKTSLTIQEIADAIDLPKSTVFRIIQSLEKAGYLVRMEDLRYCLSFRFTRLAGLVKSTLDIREIARPIIAELAERTKETVAIHTVMGRNRVCIDSMGSQVSGLRYVAQPGEQIPLQLGSASKILLAYMQPSQLSPILPAVARATKRTQSEIQAELARVRSQGYSVSHGERLLGLSAVSAPIRNLKEEVAYCLTVNGPTVRLQPHEKELVRGVKKAAGDISRQFGAQTDLT